MNKIVKRILISFLVLFILVFATLLTAPYFFKDKILTLAKQEVNALLNARADFSGIKLSFIRNFPNATVQLQDFSIVGVADFEADTLFYAKDFGMVVNLKSLFADNGYDVKRIEVDEASVKLRILPDGRANWDIMKEDTLAVEDTSAFAFHFKLQDFTIKRTNFSYIDEEGDMQLYLTNINHHTTGDLTADSSLLVTKTTAETVTFVMEGMEYLSKASAVFDATINANLNDMKFTFSENQSQLNAVPFAFDGWLKSIDNGWAMDITLLASEVDFKSLLSLVPAVYATDFASLQADGKVSLTGFVKGDMVGDYYPAFGLQLAVENAWFKYPDLPKKLDQITIKTAITNPGKTLDETVIDVSRFAFRLGNNPFAASMHITTPMSDPNVDFKANGKLNLSDIQDFYPLEQGITLQGLLDVDMLLAGRMSYYEKNQYDKFTFAGKIDITKMHLVYPSLPQALKINKASALINNRFVELSTLDMQIGRNDIQAQGKLENVVPYVLKNQTLDGQLALQSRYFNASDFMPQDSVQEETDEEPMSVIVLPKNIHFVCTATFDELVYEKMNFTNANGKLTIADGDLTINNMSVNAFGGKMLMNGVYSTTEPEKPRVDFTLQIQDVLFSEVSKQVETLSKFAPILGNALGKFSTTFSFNSLLQQDMMPDLASFMGSGKLTTSSVGLENVPALNAIAKSLKRDDIVPMVVKDIAMMFDIKNGIVTTKPFKFKVKDVDFTLGGQTGLDKSIAYTGNVRLPDKLNLGKFSNMAIAVGGTFTKPTVKVDLLSTLGAVVEEKKQEIKAQVTEKVDDAKEKALEDARLRRAKALEQANKEADKLLQEAKVAGERLVAEADKKGKALVAQANNPLTKRAAEVSAREMVKEAQKQADNLNKRAEEEAKRILLKAEQSSTF